jgi:hypothetical protein
MNRAMQEILQTKLSVLMETAYYRSTEESHFICFQANGMKETSEWLKYSKTSNAIYCYI